MSFFVLFAHEYIQTKDEPDITIGTWSVPCSLAGEPILKRSYCSELNPLTEGVEEGRETKDGTRGENLGVCSLGATEVVMVIAEGGRRADGERAGIRNCQLTVEGSHRNGT